MFPRFWVKSGVISRKLPFKMEGTGFSAFTVYRSRNGGVPVAMTTPTVVELDATNMPGWYALTLDEDTTIDAANVTEEMVLRVTHAGSAPAELFVTLFDRLPSDVVRVNGENTGVIIGTAQTGTLSITQATTDLTGFTADQLVGRRLIILDGPAGGESQLIIDFDPTGGLLTFDPMTLAMQNGDKFKIV